MLMGFNQPIHIRGNKTNTYECRIRVHGFISWPGRIAP